MGTEIVPEDWTENRVIVIRWRIAFEYHSFCICFPEKKKILYPCGGGEESVGAEGFVRFLRGKKSQCREI
jgi:hypothetical protein